MRGKSILIVLFALLQRAVVQGQVNATFVRLWGGAGLSWTMQVDAIPGKDYTVTRSSNLVTWASVTNLNIPAGRFTVTDPVLPGTPRMFYRVEQP